MTQVLDQPITQAGKSVQPWKVTVYGVIRCSDAPKRLLTDSELAAAAHSAFSFLDHPDEDIYSLEDGYEP